MGRWDIHTAATQLWEMRRLAEGEVVLSNMRVLVPDCALRTAERVSFVLAAFYHNKSFDMRDPSYVSMCSHTQQLWKKCTKTLPLVVRTCFLCLGLAEIPKFPKRGSSTLNRIAATKCTP